MTRAPVAVNILAPANKRDLLSPIKLVKCMILSKSYHERRHRYKAKKLESIGQIVITTLADSALLYLFTRPQL